jgi:hypothetical protein
MDYTKIFIVCDIQLSRNEVASGIIFECEIETRTTMRFSFEVIITEVSHYTSMDKDLWFLPLIRHPPCRVVTKAYSKNQYVGVSAHDTLQSIFSYPVQSFFFKHDSLLGKKINQSSKNQKP